MPSPKNPIKLKQYKELMSIIAIKNGYGKWMKGKKMSGEIRHKMSESHKGKERSKNHCENLSKAKKGIKFSVEHIVNIGKASKGRVHSIASRKKMSELLRGENAPNWQGGLTHKNKTIRGSLEYRLWREAVFKRDNWTCIWCKQSGETLNADHIKAFAHYPELRFVLDNGRTLCLECHKTTDTYANKSAKNDICNEIEAFFTGLIKIQ